MIIACQVKEIQICSELRKMAEMGIGITKETAEDLIQQKFEFPQFGQNHIPVYDTILKPLLSIER